MWDWCDAWILQSVAYAGRSGSLRSVIANADAINVDIPSRDQLERAVQRLEAAGLVTTDGAKVRATTAGTRIVRRSRAGMREGIRSIAPRVEATLREQVPFPAQLSRWTLPEAEWYKAYEAYRSDAVAGA
jgi:hypothetical protein